MKIAELVGALALLAGTVSAAPFKDGDTVVFLGDSITHGGFYHEYVTDFYRTRCPEADIRFVNSGVNGDNAGNAQKRVDADVTYYKPTWVLYNFGMNDVGRDAYTAVRTPAQIKHGEKCRKDYERNLVALADKVRAAVPGAKEMFATRAGWTKAMLPYFLGQCALDACKEAQRKLGDKWPKEGLATSFAVKTSFAPVEYAYLSSDRTLADEMAKLTGGSVMLLGGTNALETLNPRPQSATNQVSAVTNQPLNRLTAEPLNFDFGSGRSEVVDHIENHVWDHPAAFIVLALALILVWILRKRRGLS